MRAALGVIVITLCVLGAFASERLIIAEENTYYKPETWRLIGEAPSDREISFNLFLRQENLDQLNELFPRLTTPGSPEWRHWRTIEELKTLIETPLAERLLVREWLSRSGIESVEDKHDAFRVRSTVAAASRAFETEFFEFEHILSGTVVVRQMGPSSIPAHLQEIIHFVTGISEFPYANRKLGRSRPARDDLEGKVVPYVIDQLYAIPWENKTDVTKDSSVCVAEFEGDRSFAQSDLNKFQTDNSLPVQNVPTSQIIGPYDPSRPDAEATLDIQYAWGVSYNTNAWFWTVEGWMLEFALEFQNTSPAPSVVSMSWGWTEDSQCQITSCTNSKDYVDRVNTEFQVITMSGVTLTASSGDQGAPGDGDSTCVNTREPISSIFPGASPYVLSVGATMLVTPTDAAPSKPVADAAQPVPPICSQYTCADPTATEEVACSYPTALITTGGGFSDYSTRPSWQDAAVTAFFNTVSNSDLPPSTDYNAANRGFPDVSALGHNYLIAINGKYESVDGTSCSAPVWAGLIALFNDYEIKQGRPTLGFINPLLYNAWSDVSNSFFDITSGNNKCTESKCCEYGFPTAVGWDPVCGLGTPNFPVLYQYIQQQSSMMFKPE